jgi:hypothetical protein
MMTIWRDYFSINSALLRQSIVGLASWVCAFIAFNMLFKLSRYSLARVAIIGAGVSVIASILVVVLFLFLGAVDAWAKGTELARDAGVPLGDYVKSEEYRLNRRAKLKLSPRKKRPWW